ncbi:MAG TPA: hypothetical protein DD000_04640, partial [Cyanobacteria bacterium UBA11166]|nr:hypothetical protein [Cyanobacteria bacterium UBA11166]
IKAMYQTMPYPDVSIALRGKNHYMTLFLIWQDCLSYWLFAIGCLVDRKQQITTNMPQPITKNKQPT